MNMQISFVLSFANGGTRGAFPPWCAIQRFPSWFAVLDWKSGIVCGTEGRNCTVIAQGRAAYERANDRHALGCPPDSYLADRSHPRNTKGGTRCRCDPSSGALRGNREFEGRTMPRFRFPPNASAMAVCESNAALFRVWRSRTATSAPKSKSQSSSLLANRSFNTADLISELIL